MIKVATGANLIKEQNDKIINKPSRYSVTNASFEKTPNEVSEHGMGTQRPLDNSTLILYGTIDEDTVS